jgi:hypothetical protein
MANGEQQAHTTASTDDGCMVDWTWIEGATITAATSRLDAFVLTLSNGETLTVQAALWQGKPFLAFTPWKPRT